MAEAVIHETLGVLGLELAVLDAGQAYRAGLLRPLTKKAGLSFGDRACLALAGYLKLPVLTTDRAWGNLRQQIHDFQTFLVSDLWRLSR